MTYFQGNNSTGYNKCFCRYTKAFTSHSVDSCEHPWVKEGQVMDIRESKKEKS
jgi:hypothetical protein